MRYPSKHVYGDEYVTIYHQLAGLWNLASYRIQFSESKVFMDTCATSPDFPTMPRDSPLVSHFLLHLSLY
jgi:hypothetical protein